jgi:hypothetical protein
MKGSAFVFLLIFAMTDPQNAVPAATPAHVSNRFQFVVRAPLSRATALFGPEGEKCWAGPLWNPVFLHPQPGKDIEGAVFTVNHGPHTSVWVNTLFDLAGGRMQYVSLIPDRLVFTVDVRLTAVDSASTAVEVQYTRTALEASANDEVLALGQKDRESGPDWQQAIDRCLAAQR